MSTGAIICNGTDAPVEDVDPIPCFYATVTRKMKNGQEFFPEQKMSREEALRSYTINSAYAAFQEDILGSLTSGNFSLEERLKLFMPPFSMVFNIVPYRWMCYIR